MYTALSIAVILLRYLELSRNERFQNKNVVKNLLRRTIMLECRLEALVIMTRELYVQIDTEFTIKYCLLPIVQFFLSYLRNI